jgi:hypothetical protein
MSKSVRFIIEGENLESASDGDWTVSLFRENRMVAQSGLSGSCEDALSAALGVAIENDLAKESSDGEHS